MNLIVAAIAVPMFVAMQIFFARNTISTRIAGWIGAATMGATMLLLIFAWNTGTSDGSRWRGEFDAPWIDPLAIHFHIGLDGVSWPLALMTALLALLACVSLTDGDIGTAPLEILVALSAAELFGLHTCLRPSTSACVPPARFTRAATSSVTWNVTQLVFARLRTRVPAT